MIGAIYNHSATHAIVRKLEENGPKISKVETVARTIVEGGVGSQLSGGIAPIGTDSGVPRGRRVEAYFLHSHVYRGLEEVTIWSPSGQRKEG